MSGVTLDQPRAYFDRLARFESEHWWSTALWRIAEHWLDSYSVDRIGQIALDVGSGAGLTLARLARRPEIARAVGIEPSLEALAHAQTRGNHPLIRGSALELPFRSGSFDLVTCLDVLQHLTPRGDMLAAAEIVRVLRPGGLAIVRANAEAFRPRQLRRLFHSSPARVLTATYVNMVGSLAQEVRGRLFASKYRANPSLGGLPRESSSGRVDRLMATIGRAEAFAIGRLHLPMPFGHSTMVLLQKKYV